MKKILVTILAFVYLTSTVGATVHLHYCMDKLVAWSLMQEKPTKNKCPYCGMSKSSANKRCSKEIKGCCKDDQKQVKLENDQKLSETVLKVGKISGELINPVLPDNSFEHISSILTAYPVTHAPPRQSDVPFFILNCVYRI